MLATKPPIKGERSCPKRRIAGQFAATRLSRKREEIDEAIRWNLTTFEA